MFRKGGWNKKPLKRQAFWKHMHISFKVMAVDVFDTRKNEIHCTSARNVSIKRFVVRMVRRFPHFACNTNHKLTVDIKCQIHKIIKTLEETNFIGYIL